MRKWIISLSDAQWRIWCLFSALVCAAAIGIVIGVLLAWVEVKP